MNRRAKPLPTDKRAPLHGRLGGVRPVAHDDDERPTREDRTYGHSIFDSPVPLPKILRRGKGRSGQ